MGNGFSRMRDPASIDKLSTDGKAVKDGKIFDMRSIIAQSQHFSDLVADEEANASLMSVDATSTTPSQPVSQLMGAGAADLDVSTNASLVATATLASASQPASQLMGIAADLGETSSASVVVANTPASVSQPMDATAAERDEVTSVSQMAAVPLVNASMPGSQAIGAASLEGTGASLVATTPVRGPQQTPQSISATARAGQLVTPSTIVRDGDYKTANFHAREHFSYIIREGNRLLSSGEVPEEVCGSIRKAIQKSNLVLGQLVEIEKLRRKYEKPGEADEYVITESEVAGAWDFTRIQMEEVDALFTEINDIKENGWQPLPEPADTPPRTPARNPSSIRRPLFTPDPNSPVARRAQESREEFMRAKRILVLQKKKQQQLEEAQKDEQNEGQQPT